MSAVAVITVVAFFPRLAFESGLSRKRDPSSTADPWAIPDVVNALPLEVAVASRFFGVMNALFQMWEASSISMLPG